MFILRGKKIQCYINLDYTLQEEDYKNNRLKLSNIDTIPIRWYSNKNTKLFYFILLYMNVDIGCDLQHKHKYLPYMFTRD